MKKPIKPKELNITKYPIVRGCNWAYFRDYGKYKQDLDKYEKALEEYNQTKFLKDIKNSTLKSCLKKYKITKK